MKILRNNYDKEACFAEDELAKAKAYYKPMDLQADEEFLGTEEELESWKQQRSEYAAYLEAAETLEELVAVFNRNSDKFDNGSELYVYDYNEKVIHEIEEELKELEGDLKSLENGEPTSCNGVGWDGDTSNTYGRDCVYTAICEKMNELEEELEGYRE